MEPGFQVPESKLLTTTFSDLLFHFIEGEDKVLIDKSIAIYIYKVLFVVS